MKTKDSSDGAKKQFRTEREYESSVASEIERKDPNYWVRPSKMTMIPPRSVTLMKYDMHSIEGPSMILSDHDNDDLDVLIPSIKRETGMGERQIVVENCRNA